MDRVCSCRLCERRQEASIPHGSMTISTAKTKSYDTARAPAIRAITTPRRGNNENRCLYQIAQAERRSVDTTAVNVNGSPATPDEIAAPTRRCFALRRSRERFTRSRYAQPPAPRPTIREIAPPDSRSEASRSVQPRRDASRSRLLRVARVGDASVSTSRCRDGGFRNRPRRGYESRPQWPAGSDRSTRQGSPRVESPPGSGEREWS